MGLYDTVLFVDRIDEVRCPGGHALRWFQTKDIIQPWDMAEPTSEAMAEPGMSTYLVHHGRLYRAETSNAWSEVEGEWNTSPIAGDEAVRVHRFELHEVRGPLIVRVYGSCKACAPVLVRTAEPGLLGDIVNEHRIFVDFRLTLGRDTPIVIERTSGTRDDLKADLRSRGVYVLGDDEPLAVAHR